MKKCKFCLLCAVLILAGLLSACSKMDTNQNLTTQPTQTEEQNAQEQTVQATSTVQPISTVQPTTVVQPNAADLRNTTEQNLGTYWKTAGFDGIENKSDDDYWSDLFLWEDGTGYFRFSQASPASHYYGMYDVSSCDWVLEKNGLLTLYDPGKKTILYSGMVKENSLTLRYDGYTEETIKMEQAEMPPYGSQWTILDLYGTWRMTSRTNAANGYQTVGYYSVGGADGYFASEITLDQVIGAHFWLAYPLNNEFEMVHDMRLGFYDANDEWHPVEKGPIWEGCVNEAWHVALTGNTDPNIRFFVTCADDKLLLRKEDSKNPNNSFTAEFEYVGYRGDFGEGDGIDIINKRYGEVAYAVILDQYRGALQFDWDSDKIVNFLVDCLGRDANINDEMELSDLYTSIFEPLHYSGSGVFGYEIRDINKDGIPELLILSENPYEKTINAIYTMHNNRTVLVGAYWSRNQCKIAANGTIYGSGSSGADDSFSASYSLNPKTGKLQLIRVMSFSEFFDLTADAAELSFTPMIKTSSDSTSGDGTLNSGDSSVGTAATSSFSTDKANYLFSSIVEYNGKVYSIYASPAINNFIGIKGTTKFTPLPEGIDIHLEAEGEGMYVYNFTIYQNKIYYLAAEPGSALTSGIIYRCNLDGSQHELLAYANNYSVCMIHENKLYHNGETEGGDFITAVTDLDTLRFMQGVDFPVEIEPGICEYNGFYYYFSDRTLYKKDIKTESISTLMTLTTSPMNTYGGSVIAVVNDIVYYATAGEYGENGNSHVFGVSIYYGGTGEYLASWFAA